MSGSIFGLMGGAGLPALTIEVDYNEKTRSFKMRGNPYRINDLRGIPNRRYDKRNDVWTAPNTSANVRYLKSNATFVFTEIAKQQIEEALEPTKQVELVTWAWKTKPMAHQQEALSIALRRDYLALLLPTGTGKTKLAIDIAAVRYERKEIDRLILLVPASLQLNWQEEFETHCHVDYTFDRGNGLKISSFTIEGLGITKSGFEKALALCGERTMIVVDESTKIKNPDAVRTQRAIHIAQKCKYRHIMSGTPITKGPQDLYSQFEFMSPSLFGRSNYVSFRNRYCVMGGYQNREVIGYDNMEELLEIAASCSYQVGKRTVLPDLPDKVYTQRYCKPTSEQAALFKEIRKNRETLTENGVITAKNVLERMLRLQSVCGGFVNVETELGKVSTPVGKTNPKINLLIEFLDEFDEPALIWTPYISEIKAIGEVLEKKYGSNSVGYLYGNIDRDTRQRYVNDLQRGSIRYIVGNPSTGGIGLTMTAAKAAIYFTNSYNYIDRVQSEDRIHRKGQTDKVLIVDFVMENTVDEVVMMALKAKSDVSDFIRDNLQLILDNNVI